MMTAVIEETIRVRAATLHRCSDGIIEIRMADGSRAGVDELEELLTAQQKLTHRMASVLVDARGMKSMTRRAQELAANAPVNDLTAATAILVESAVSTLLGNFFIRFAKPTYPARVFRDEDEARRWLRNRLEERTRA